MKAIPYGHQWIDSRDTRAVTGVLGSEWVTQGPRIGEFENRLAAYTKARYAVAVSSGTAALHIAALAAGLGPGDEAITSPITFLASANCILYCGARPIFADVEPRTVNIDPDEIKKKITKKTKAIIPVDFGGHPCKSNAIKGLAKKSGLIVIEDAAHALGGEYKGKKIGSCEYSDMTALSFHPVKAITTGEGGAVLTNDERLYGKLLLLRNHGIVKGIESIDKRAADCGWYYEMHELGFNYRMTDMQAALGISQLRRLDAFINRRREIAKIYDSAFSGNPFFDLPAEERYARSAYHLYPIRLKDALVPYRKEIFSSMRRDGLGVQVHYIPVYKQPYYRSHGLGASGCPNAEDYYKRAISIPIYPAMTNAAVKRVIDIVLKVISMKEK